MVQQCKDILYKSDNLGPTSRKSSTFFKRVEIPPTLLCMGVEQSNRLTSLFRIASTLRHHKGTFYFLEFCRCITEFLVCMVMCVFPILLNFAASDNSRVPSQERFAFQSLATGAVMIRLVLAITCPQCTQSLPDLLFADSDCYGLRLNSVLRLTSDDVIRMFSM